MLKRDRNFKNVGRADGRACSGRVGSVVGRVGCIGLLALAFLLVNPIVGSSARAMEEDGGENGADSVVDGSGRVADGSADNDANEGIMPTATHSEVSISFNPVSGTASLTPTNAEGASAKINVSADVSISNTGGYTIYLSGKNAALTGNKTGQTIPATSTTTTFSNLKTNTWGYAAVEGLNVSDTTTYTALPQGQGIKLAEGSGNATNVKRTFTLSFATRVGNDKPADTYSNQVVISVTSSPKTITFTDYTTTMQGMTSSICEAVDTGAEAQLRDTRDGKYYWVAKLADGKCWMTQNLDLDLGSGWPDASQSDYDTANATYSPVPTQTQQITIDGSRTNTRSWNFGEYVITNPIAALSCGVGKNDLSTCTSQFTNVAGKIASTDPNFYTKNSGKTVVGNEYDAHYLIGNHYSWNTATAGTGGDIKSGEASGSICPKNWRLPTSNNANPGSFGSLINAGGIGTDVAKLAGDDYFFVRGGVVSQATNVLLGYSGDNSYYWSSTPNPSDTSIYYFFFSGSNIVYPAASGARQDGFSVRCIAR